MRTSFFTFAAVQALVAGAIAERHLSAPSVSTPSVSAPSISKPSVSAPSVSVPVSSMSVSVSAPVSVSMSSSISVPSISAPSISLHARATPSGTVFPKLHPKIELQADKAKIILQNLTEQSTTRMNKIMHVMQELPKNATDSEKSTATKNLMGVVMASIADITYAANQVKSLAASPTPNAQDIIDLTTMIMILMTRIINCFASVAYIIGNSMALKSCVTVINAMATLLAALDYGQNGMMKAIASFLESGAEILTSLSNYC